MSKSSNEAQRQDWQDREFIEIISRQIKKIAVFLNSFDITCRGKLAALNESITHLERRVDFLEASIAGATTAAAVVQPAVAPSAQQQPQQPC